MKKSIFLIVGIVLAVNFSSVAQGWSGNEDKFFYCSIGGGATFSANGDCLSQKSGKMNPPFMIEVGVQPRKTDFLQIGAQMGSFQLSPAMVDIWQKSNPRCATILLKVGTSFGRESLFTGGVNVSGGIGFVDLGNQLGNYPILGLSLEGGINATNTFSILVSSTYYYLWKGKSSMLKTDGFALVPMLNLRWRF